MNNNCKTACFIGHRKIELTESLKLKVQNTVTLLIKSGVENFIFGDHSNFNNLCYNVVSNLKIEYPYIRRIHFRYNNPQISESVKEFFVSGYEESVFDTQILNSGKGSYIKRNKAMINNDEVP